MTKIANVVAVELAIMIGLLSWLVFTGPFAERRSYSEIPENAAPVATTVRLPEPRPQSLAMIDSNADARRVPPHDQQPLVAQQPYVQAVPAQTYPNPSYGNATLAAEMPVYEESGQVSEVVPSDYAASADTLVYAEPAPVVLYAVPYQVVIFSNGNHFAHRHRPAFHSGIFPANFARHQNPGAFQPVRGGMVNPRNIHSVAQQGFRPSGRR